MASEKVENEGSGDSLPGTNRARANGLEPMGATEAREEMIYCLQAPADLPVPLWSCLHDGSTDKS